MAKVNTVKFVIDGKLAEFGVYYTASDKFFVKDFPLEILKVNGFNEYQKKRSFDSEQELKDGYQAFIDKYHKARKESRKVILFDVDASDELIHDDEGDLLKEFAKLFGEKNRGYNHRKNWEFEIDFSIMWEVQDNGLHYHQCRDDGSIGSRDSVSKRLTIIDWTPEREKFFMDLKEAMRKLVLKVASVLKDENKVMEIADAGLQLLGPPSIVQWAQSKD